MKVGCLYREAKYSPGMVDKDKAIMDAVMRCVCGMGHDFVPRIEDADVVFSMSRSAERLDLLRKLELRGVRIINSPQSIERCQRNVFTQLFTQHSIPIPPSVVLRKDAPGMPELNYPLWVKRGDGYSECKDDVVYVSDSDECKRSIGRLFGRDYSCVVVSQHAEGDLIKFYGVRGTSFFRCYYATDGFSKFGLEAINGKPRGFAFNPDEAHRICLGAADVLQLDIYGGDLVVAEDGSMRIIDFNDWPSFSRCRDEAAHAISTLMKE